MQIHARLWLTLTSATLLATAPMLGGCATPSAQDRAEAARKAIAHLDLGAEHLNAGRPALALREFLAGEALDPSNARLQHALGEAFLAQGKHKESEEHYLRAIELSPSFHDARLGLSALYILEERYPEAIAACKVLIDDPTFPAPWRALANLGFAELREGDLVDARKHLELARQYHPDYWPAMLSLSQVELQEGHRPAAIELLRKVISLQPGPGVEAEANYRIAEIYVSLGQRDEAVGHLTIAVARAPQGVWGKRSEEYLKLLK
jgi:Tfp pilus assembly protein PilF